jgi:FkbM family methyltransferase
MAFSTNDSYVGRSYDLYGEYSDAEVQFVKRVLKPSQIVLDVGANLGGLTIPMAQSVGRDGIVLALEPQRFTYYALCTNVFLNNLNNVFCYQRAVGREPGTVLVPDLNYSIPGNYGAWTPLREEEGCKGFNRLPVDVITIDQLGLAGVDFIKIDVEGMERDVLDGGRQTIMAHRPLLYVEDDRPEQLPRLLEFLKDAQYRAWQHFPPLYNPDNMKRAKDNVFNNEVSANLFCVPAEKPVDPDLVAGLQPVAIG